VALPITLGETQSIRLSQDAEGRLRRFGGEGRGGGGKRCFALVIFCFDVIVEQRLKGGGQFVVISFQRCEMLAVDVNGAAWRLSRARQADTDVGGF
jgi:hypothetical protein